MKSAVIHQTMLEQNEIRITWEQQTTLVSAFYWLEVLQPEKKERTRKTEKKERTRIRFIAFNTIWFVYTGNGSIFYKNELKIQQTFGTFFSLSSAFILLFLCIRTFYQTWRFLSWYLPHWIRANFNTFVWWVVHAAGDKSENLANYATLNMDCVLNSINSLFVQKHGYLMENMQELSITQAWVPYGCSIMVILICYYETISKYWIFITLKFDMMARFWGLFSS